MMNKLLSADSTCQGALVEHGTKQAIKLRRSFRFARPERPDDAKSNLWYRVLLILASSVVPFIVILTFGALNSFEVEAWMVVVAIGLALIPLCLGEFIRRILFDKFVQSKSETVELRVSRNGLMLSESDFNFLSKNGLMQAADVVSYGEGHSTCKDQSDQAYGFSEEQTPFCYRSDFREPKRSFYSTAGKRLFDIGLVVLAAPVILPLIGFFAVIISLEGGNPFYSQLRIGRGGKTYRIWKLRTMVPNADAVLEEYLTHNPTLRAEWDACQKLRYDPRVTRIGFVLRKCSVDELPQIWSVLRGDMSLVGPRPLRVCQKDSYPGIDNYDLRPGIIGMWQISDRHDTSLGARARYDEVYKASLSFGTDVRIMLKAVNVTLRFTGL